MSYQKCPVCHGSGEHPKHPMTVCPVCKGACIINEKTGRPPVDLNDIIKTRVKS